MWESRISAHNGYGTKYWHTGWSGACPQARVVGPTPTTLVVLGSLLPPSAVPASTFFLVVFSTTFAPGSLRPPRRAPAEASEIPGDVAFSCLRSDSHVLAVDSDRRPWASILSTTPELRRRAPTAVSSLRREPPRRVAYSEASKLHLGTWVRRPVELRLPRPFPPLSATISELRHRPQWIPDLFPALRLARAVFDPCRPLSTSVDLRRLALPACLVLRGSSRARGAPFSVQRR